MSNLQLKDFEFDSLFDVGGLERLDQRFLDTLPEDLKVRLLSYRHQSGAHTAVEVSDLLIASAGYLEPFIAELFGIESDVQQLKAQILSHDPVFAFKKEFVLKFARRKVSKKTELDTFEVLDDWLEAQLPVNDDRELAIAVYGMSLSDQEANDKLVDWCVAVLTEEAGKAATEGWSMFQLPQRLDYEHLVLPESDIKLRQRDGFALTDQRMSTREVQDEIHYCVYCHDKEGDFCSKGFPVKKNKPELGLKKNPLDEFETGCPLEEKISEMHVLRKNGLNLAALAMVMVDNPMCAVTGHRICNDCMKACIYQKQKPVDIPQVETGVLTDTLGLPWGVEIYDLLTRWNPLRQKQYLPQQYNGKKVLVMGMGPAGFSLAHHLLMSGFAVVGVDGLKIEPLNEQYISSPIRNFEDIREPLDDRIMAGFGGVAEYGITVRWDKNFLKLIYITLMRRPHFSVYGGVRFGGTITVDDAWQLGFDHLAIAVGAGLPRELPIPGSMAPGMRQANDFLMALQLTGAAKSNSLANLQVRLPAVVIGGGLTGVDTATEVQAYYIAQVEKTLQRYDKLVSVLGESRVHEHFPELEFAILHEFLSHGRQVAAERVLATQENRQPDFIKLIREWGGVSIVYRRKMQDSPAYKRNHEELSKALEEGIYYLEEVSPVEAQLDHQGQVCALKVDKLGDELIIPARAILVATGAKPNVAYEFEHKGTFHREGMEYKAYDQVEDKFEIVHPEGHCKTEKFGPFTSYNKDNYRVSFLGDTHPVFHGSVVKAIASAQRIYPKIVESFGDGAQEIGQLSEYKAFSDDIKQLFDASITKILRHSNSVIEVKVKAPMAARNFQPGQFYRVQNFETTAKLVGGTRLQSEAMAMIGADVDKKTGDISFMVMEHGASSRLFATFKEGDAISVMGPTGVRTRISQVPETVMVIGGRYGAAHIRSVGPAMRAAGSKVLYIAGFKSADDVYCQDALEDAADVIVWVTELGEKIKARRPQDRSATGPFIEVLAKYAAGELDRGEPPIKLSTVDRVFVVGTKKLVKMVQGSRKNELKKYFSADSKFIASIYGPMQCMLKGVCAQCLQWQIDPKTGQRTKAVFACSWQDQPLDIVDIDNLEDRLAQNRSQELLTNLWLDYLFSHYDIDKH